jgi:quercetin dioxygenase-like cupin family protein
MALPKTVQWTPGSIVATIYDFASPGDILPMHTHTSQDVHITIISSGSIRVKTPDGKTADFSARDHIEFMPGQPHEFESLEPNTRITNILKGQTA